MSNLLGKFLNDSGLFEVPQSGFRETPKRKRSKADSARRKAESDRLARALALRRDWSPEQFDEEDARLQLEIEQFLTRKAA